MTIHGRPYFRRWLQDVPISSMHQFRVLNFLPDLAKPLISTKLLSPTFSLVTLDQHLYPLDRLKQFPTRLDVGVRVASLSDFRYRVHVGFFRPSETQPVMLGSFEQSLMDEKQRVVRIPRDLRNSLIELYSKCPQKLGLATSL